MAGGEPHEVEGQASQEVSDLIGAELAVAVIVWLLLVFAAFFFVGAVLGLILVAAGVIGFGWLFVSAIRRADTSD
jgi:hypothetical protein